MDLVHYNEEIFNNVDATFRRVTSKLNFKSVVSHSLSALKGDNVIQKSENTEWFDGPTLFDHLETVDIGSPSTNKPFRMPING